MSNSNLLNILKNKALKKKNAVLKITTSAIPTVQDPTLQTWIKSIDTSLRQLSKTSVSKTELDSAIASSGSGSSIGLDPNAELPDGEIDLTVPSAVTNLQASGAYSSVTLDWDTPKNYNFGRNVVYRSEVDDFGTAVEIGSTVGDVYTDYTGNGGKYYYWVRTISKYNVEGILSTSVYAETSLNVQYLLDQLTEKINLNQFTQALKSTIDLIPSKGEVIFGSTAPVADKRLAQNLWIDTTSNLNMPKRWNGSAWVAVTDKAATDAAAAASAAQTTANTATSNIATVQTKVNTLTTQQSATAAAASAAQTTANTATSNIATVQTKVNTLTTQQSATASTVSTIQTTVDGHTSSIQETKTAVDGINAEWKIKVQAGGKVSGVSLGTTGEESDFTVLTNRFSVVSPDGLVAVPFVIDTDGRTIVNTAVIKDGSIANAKIGSLSADKITAGDIAADRMKANIVQAVEGQFTSLSAVSGTIGTLRTATSGARTEIRDNLIQVFDSAGKVRVKLGVW